MPGRKRITYANAGPNLTASVCAEEPEHPLGFHDSFGTRGGLDPQQGLDAWFAFAAAEGEVHGAGNQAGSSDLEQIERIVSEERSLLRFCTTVGLHRAAVLTRLACLTTPTLEGHEHRVFILPAERRVVKITWPGQYGRWEHAPSQYLRRWA